MNGRNVTAIDKNLKFVREARMTAWEALDRALRSAGAADTEVIACEARLAACDKRIDELLDERLRC